MSRYQPSTEEQAAIDMLTLAGYTVVRRGTYENLRKRIDQMEWTDQWREREMGHSREYAEKCHAEERRLSDRLTTVVAGAAAAGVPFDVIQQAMGEKP